MADKYKSITIETKVTQEDKILSENKSVLDAACDNAIARGLWMSIEMCKHMKKSFLEIQDYLASEAVLLVKEVYDMNLTNEDIIEAFQMWMDVKRKHKTTNSFDT